MIFSIENLIWGINFDDQSFGSQKSWDQNENQHQEARTMCITEPVNLKGKDTQILIFIPLKTI